MHGRIAELRALVEYARSRVSSVLYEAERGSPLYSALRDAYDKLDGAGDELRWAWLATSKPTGPATAAGKGE